ncbi:type II CAAX endopeptidase family protein [Amycolatopsis sp. NPDC004079]|uniref:CPBP family intramembrane glutamic endopeptidase n=1 Tax=Amycolatopsis sp. NPDC004079 TaxID=3154549 RepID=UPI0033B388A6
MTTSQPREPLSSALSPEDFVAEPTAFPPHRWGFGAFLLVEAVLLASAAFIGALAGPTAPGRPLPISTVLLGTMLPTMIAAGVAVLVTVVRGNGPKLDLRLEWRWADVWTGLKFGMLGLVLTSLSAYVWTELVGSADATSAISALVDDRKMSVPAAAVMFGYLWLLGPICEEIIYRGLLWGAVERLQWRSERWGRFAAFLLSTAVFAASHLEPLRTTLLLVISIPIGLARLSTGRLAGSIVAHAVNNFLPAVAILLGALGLASF